MTFATDFRRPLVEVTEALSLHRRDDPEGRMSPLSALSDRA